MIQGELDELLAKYAKDGDNKSPHHMSSNASINKNERIQRDLLMVYAETRPNVDLDVVEYKLT